MASADFQIKEDDTAPSLVSRLLDADGNAVNLTGATVTFFMGSRWAGTLKVSAAATVTDAENGTVTYEWQAGDTDTHGRYYGEFQATFSDGSVQTFPNSRHLEIEVVRDLGP